MLMTKPDKLKKILRKEAMEKDLKKKTSQADPRKKALEMRKKLKMKQTNIQISGENSYESSIEPHLTTKNKRNSLNPQFRRDGTDHLPFPTLITRIAKRLPGYPQKPKMRMIFDFKYFKEIFTHYSNDVRKAINLNLKLPQDVEINSDFKSVIKKKSY